MYFLIRFISCIIDTTLCLFLLKYVIDNMVSLNRKIIIGVIISSLFGAVIDSIVGGNPGTMLVITTYPILIHLIQGTERIYKKIGRYLLVFLLYMSFSLFSVFIETIVFEIAFGAADTNTRFTIISMIVNTLVTAGLWNYCEKRKLHIELAVKEWILLFVVNVFTFLLLSALKKFGELIYTENWQDQLLIIFLNYSVLLFYIFFVMFLTSGKVASHFKEINRLSKHHMSEQLQYFKSYKQTQEEIRRYRHDMKNHFLYLQALCNENNVDEIKQYLQSLNDRWNDLPQLCTTGDESLDTIINAKQFLFEENAIQFYLEGTFTSSLDIEPIDISIIFSNAIDNAIESNKEIKDKKNRYINFNIKSSEYHYLIQIENPAKTAVKIIDSQILTKKENTEHHGYGLQNITQALKQNDGYMKLVSTENIFQIEIVLPR
ncbi:MAG: sensor histidine kinase [Lachnospiraceae bacterium]